MATRTHIRAVPLFALSALSVLTLSWATSAGAVQPNGTVTGKLFQCGPGPVASVPGQPAPKPSPVSIALVRNQRTWAAQLVAFSKKTWSGSFSLSAPAGRYEVVVAIPAYPVRWVTIKSGAHKVVSFGVIACAS
jgi:hypothetical protein